jgi:peptidyl-prolyl cis-trans isomerase SurA
VRLNARSALTAAAIVSITATGLAPLLQAQGTPPTPVVPATQAVPEPRGLPLDRIVAIVGSRAILLSEVIEEVNSLRAQGQPVPQDSVGQLAMMKRVVNELVDNEVVVVVAKAYKADVTDEDVAKSVDERFSGVRKNFKSETEFREAIKREGFGTPEDYRRTLREQGKRYKLQQLGYDSLRAHGRLSAPVQVTEAEVNTAFAASKDKLPTRPATVSFRQIVVAPRPAPAAKATARAKAEALLVELQKGADFATVAKRESMDPGSRELGGDLGWARRGSGFVPEFERVIFSLPPGQISGVVETSFGFHIIKVDRIQPAEVKSRHILIASKLDSNDVARARLVADTVLQKWRAGTPYDSLVARYHDPAEERSLPDGIAVDSLPEMYKSVIKGVAAKEFTPPFEIPDPRAGQPKIGIVQVLDRKEGGEYTVADLKTRIRSQLTQEKQIRRMLDQLRRENYVRVLFDEPAPAATKPVP